jgi:uncharacterized protein
MDTKTKLNESMKEAMKSGDEVRKRTIRMVLAAVKQVEVDKQALDDWQSQRLIQKEVKNRREALEEAKKASREDLVAGMKRRSRCWRNSCRKAMPADELRALVEAAIAETGASAPSDMGKVMKIVMPKVAGRAPNDMISAAVRELLTK